MLVTAPSSKAQMPFRLEPTSSDLQGIAQRVCQATSSYFSKKTFIAVIVTVSLIVIYALYARGRHHKKDQNLPNQPKTTNDKKPLPEEISSIKKNALGSPVDSSTPINLDPISSNRLCELDTVTQNSPSRRRHARTMSEGGSNFLSGPPAGKPPVAPPPSIAETPEPHEARLTGDGPVARGINFHETKIAQASPASQQPRSRSASVGDGSFLRAIPDVNFSGEF